MKNTLSLLLIITLFACENTKNEQQTTKSKIKTFKKNDDITIQIDEKQGQVKKKEIIEDTVPNSSLYVALIQKFDTGNYHHIPLFYKKEWTRQVKNALENGLTDSIFQNDSFSRTKLNDSIANKYFNTNYLDQLLVFNSQQVLFDTLNRKHYEYYENMIESGYVASYLGQDWDGDLIAISLNEYDTSLVKESLMIKKDQTYLDSLFIKNNYTPDHINFKGFIHNKVDTMALLSFSDYSKGLDVVYLIRNGIVVDSVFDEYLVLDLIPVPLAHDYEYFYMAYMMVPETDIMWYSLISIDFKTNKFKLHQGNRITIPKSTKFNDCIFNSDFYGLTNDWMKKLGVKNYLWDEENHEAKFSEKGDTIAIKRGGCVHFVSQIEKRFYNQKVGLNDTVYLKEQAIDLLTQFGFQMIADSLQSDNFQINYENEEGYWFVVGDADEMDNLFYEGVEVKQKDNYVYINYGEYFN